MARWRRWLCLGGLLCLVLAPIAWGTRGTVKTGDGQSFTGDVVRNDDGSVTVTNAQGIQTRIDANDVAVVLPSTTADDEFYARLNRLDASDVRGRMDLADWASQNARPDLAEVALRQVLTLQPNNRAAALALQGADRQIELDHDADHPHPTSQPAGHALGAGMNGPTSTPTTQRVRLPAPGLLLTDEQVNTLRQKELPADDIPLRILLRNDVVRRYLAGGGHDAHEFRAMSIGQQARAILATGDPDLAADVRIVTDPPSLRIFRQRISPIVATACGSIACHGGTSAGDFHFYANDVPNAAYTNFYVLQRYSHSVGGVPYFAVDRTLPERSLILQFGLAADQATVSHPPVPGYRPRYRTRSDGGYEQVLDWITNDLNPVLPDYGLPVSPYFTVVSPAATRPATAPSTKP